MFIGCGTALVTPFHLDGSLDEPTLRFLVKRQIEAGVDFLVPCGTTGESPTLTREEHLRVVEIVVETAKGKVPVLAGAGGYNTAEVIVDAERIWPKARTEMAQANPEHRGVDWFRTELEQGPQKPSESQESRQGSRRFFRAWSR